MLTSSLYINQLVVCKVILYLFANFDVCMLNICRHFKSLRFIVFVLLNNFKYFVLLKPFSLLFRMTEQRRSMRDPKPSAKVADESKVDKDVSKGVSASVAANAAKLAKASKAKMAKQAAIVAKAAKDAANAVEKADASKVVAAEAAGVSQSVQDKSEESLAISASVNADAANCVLD
jgi:ABC-type Na+ efflux pump permease subunit